MNFRFGQETGPPEAERNKMFFGPDATQFYSAVGWGTTATIPVLVVCWILIASVILIRTPEKSAA